MSESRMYYGNGEVSPWYKTEDGPPKKRKPVGRDYKKARLCTPEIESAIPIEDRARLAHDFGENWACVISGCGDQ